MKSIMARIQTKKVIWGLYAAGVLILLVGAWLWCHKLATNPERAFWRSIEQGLTISGVTTQAEQSNGQSTARQFSQYSFGASARSHTLTISEQEGTTVKNETIGLPKADYMRYFSIKTDQKKQDGTPLDFSKIIGVWAKGPENKGQLFTQAVLGSSLPIGGMTIPLGNVAPEARSKLVKQLKDDVVYQVDFKKVKKSRKDGRLVYTYSVTVQPVAYAALMKQFAKLSGLHDLDELDPTSYKGQPSLKLQFAVDVRAGHVISVTSPTNGYTQSFTSYDVPVRIEAPKRTISLNELQQRLANLQ